jgi:hypothetical protein
MVEFILERTNKRGKTVPLVIIHHQNICWHDVLCSGME